MRQGVILIGWEVLPQQPLQLSRRPSTASSPLFQHFQHLQHLKHLHVFNFRIKLFVSCNLPPSGKSTGRWRSQKLFQSRTVRKSRACPPGRTKILFSSVFEVLLLFHLSYSECLPTRRRDSLFLVLTSSSGWAHFLHSLPCEPRPSRYCFPRFTIFACPESSNLRTHVVLAILILRGLRFCLYPYTAWASIPGSLPSERQSFFRSPS